MSRDASETEKQTTRVKLKRLGDENQTSGPKMSGFRLELKVFRLELELAKVFGRNGGILGHLMAEQRRFASEQRSRRSR